jgi:hypothetical protein
MEDKRNQRALGVSGVLIGGTGDFIGGTGKRVLF